MVFWGVKCLLSRFSFFPILSLFGFFPLFIWFMKGFGLFSSFFTRRFDYSQIEPLMRCWTIRPVSFQGS